MLERSSPVQLKITECLPAATALELTFTGPNPPKASILERLAPSPLNNKKTLFLGLFGPLARGAFFPGEKDVSLNTDTFCNPSQVPKKLIRRVDGVVIVINQESLPQLPAWGKEISSKLGPGKQLWLLEEKNTPLSSEERENRLNLIKDWGLVGRKVVGKKGTPYHYSYGHIPKPHHHQEIDLTSKLWFRKRLATMLDELWAAGWEKIDPQEAVDNCQKSRYPPKDLSNLDLGFGIALSAPCGCRWHVDFQGEWSPITHCIDEDCPGTPRAPRQPKAGKTEDKGFLIGFNIPAVKRGQALHCDHCGGPLFFNRVVDHEETDQNGQESTFVLSELFCPHDGLRGTKPRLITVRPGTKIVLFDPGDPQRTSRQKSA